MRTSRSVFADSRLWVPARSFERPSHRTTSPGRELPRRRFPASLLSLALSHVLTCRNSRIRAQDVRAVSGRCSSACRARTSLGRSTLQGLTVLTLERISPLAPLSLLPPPHRPWLEPQGLNRSTPRLRGCCAEALPLSPSRPPGLPTLVPPPAAANADPGGLMCSPQSAEHVAVSPSALLCRVFASYRALLRGASGSGCRVTGERSVVHAR